MARQGAVGVEDFIRNKVSKMRHWKMTSLGKKRPRWGFQFTVMTYNILSQSAIDCHSYLYMKCSPQYLTEEYRLSRIIPEVLKSKSDVVCLQEVEQHVYDQSIRRIFDSNGFGSIFKKRTGGKSDGCAILWRKAKFTLLRHQEVEFKARGCEYLNRDNVGLIAVLLPRHSHGSHAQLHVATTHLIYNPRRGDVKLCQLRLLLAELERSAFKGVTDNGRVYHPTILCGDFNFEPHSPLCEFVESGRLEVDGLVSGNLSGQHEGKNKGGRVFEDKLSLHCLGIHKSGRFSQEPNGGIVDRVWLPRGTTFEKDESSSSCSSDSESNAVIFYHDFDFVSAYKYHQQQQDYPLTSMTGHNTNTVDHIFYNVKHKSQTSYTEGRLKLLGTYTLPSADELREVGGLPNAHLGSDHVSLISKFNVTFRR